MLTIILVHHHSESQKPYRRVGIADPKVYAHPEWFSDSDGWTYFVTVLNFKSHKQVLRSEVNTFFQTKHFWRDTVLSAFILQE